VFVIPAERLQQWMTPFWKSEIVYDESVLMVANSLGVPEAGLLFEPTSIMSVKDSTLQNEYKEGADWKFADGKLRLLPGTKAAYLTKEQLYRREPGEHTQPKADGNGYLYFSEGHFFHERQLFVTYRRGAGRWEGPVPQFQESRLRDSIRKLKEGRPLQLVLYGDSIAEGYNASGFASREHPVEPYMPSWGELVAETLRWKYGAPVQFLNHALSGQDTEWGVNHVRRLVSEKRPDLVILAFGMNDGTKRLPPGAFQANIRAMMEDVREINPRVEFILVSPMLPNPESTFVGCQRDYREVLLALTGSGVAMADMTAVHEQLLLRKSYQDLTGNNINHPNDFLIRWYAQQVAGLLVNGL
jgi:lysophospholipase L1-like esterase